MNTHTKTISRLILPLLAVATLAPTVWAQTPAQQVSAPKRIIGFRATTWKTVHSSSNDQAEQVVATLKKLGCEVKTSNHGDHVDVSYRCENWRSMHPETETLLHQWSTWCQDQGMETVVVNPPSNTQRPTVKFRLPQTKTVHLHDRVKADQIINTLTLVGCQVRKNEHDGHLDATFSCPNWVTIELPSEDSAHAWQKWFDESGFETQHTHVQ